MPVYLISVYDRHQHACTGSRAEARLRRAADPLAARRAPPPRLRAEQVDPRTVRRPADVPHRFALSVAVSPGGARMDQGHLGRTARRAAPPVLQGDGGGAPGTGRATEDVGG